MYIMKHIHTYTSRKVLRHPSDAHASHVSIESNHKFHVSTFDQIPSHLLTHQLSDLLIRTCGRAIRRPRQPGDVRQPSVEPRPMRQGGRRGRQGRGGGHSATSGRRWPAEQLVRTGHGRGRGVHAAPRRGLGGTAL